MRDATPSVASPLWANLVLTFLASIGTGILWSGVSFIAKHEFDYSAELNYVLYLVTALTYVAAAFASGPMTRFLGRWISPRAFLAWLLLVQAMVCVLPLVVLHHVTLWFVACVTSVIAALLWPIVESYLTAGRHGRDMRSAMGWWNMTWTISVAVAMLMLAPFIGGERAILGIVALGPVSLIALLALPWFTRAPGHHDETMHTSSITMEYPLLLRSVRMLLPMSYLLIGAVSPLMPYRLHDLEVALSAETPVTATWMIVRVFAIALMWKLAFWHGRWGTLLLGGTTMTIGFAAIVFAPTLMVLLIGLSLLGAGQGVVYYAALYYAMSVGKAQVDAGGTHEGLIGLGYAMGPVSSLVGKQLPSLPGLAMGTAGGIVTAVTFAMTCAAVPALWPYVLARRQRRRLHGEALRAERGAPDEECRSAQN
jgi:MFS family permease